MAGTFISYRREDAAGYAGRLRESLERRLGASVFRDVDTLRPGQDFVQAIEARLASCPVMLVVIGREWIDARLASGGRRLDDPYDFVRLEVAAGLARPDVLVIPVLVEGASMPSAADLPENIRMLARRHAVSVRDETWDADVQRLVGVIQSVAVPGGTVEAPQPALQPAPLWRHPRTFITIGAALSLLLLWLALRPRVDENLPDAPGARREQQQDATVPAASGDPAAARLATLPAYAIDTPRVAEVSYGELVYTLVSGAVVPRDDGPELRLRMRLSNGGAYGVNFWDRSFRLAVDGNQLSPTSNLNDQVPGHSLRYGIVTFRPPAGATRAILQIFNEAAYGEPPAEIPLDLSSSGRPPLDETAPIADSLSQAIVRSVLPAPARLFDVDGATLTVDRASTRRFANALRLSLSIRINNQGSGVVFGSSLVLRAETGGESVAPREPWSDRVEAHSTGSAAAQFDLPTSAELVTIRATLDGRPAALPLDVR